MRKLLKPIVDKIFKELLVIFMGSIKEVIRETVDDLLTDFFKNSDLFPPEKEAEIKKELVQELDKILDKISNKVDEKI